MKSNDDRKIVTFEKTGLGSIQDDVGEDDIEVNKYTTSAVIVEQVQGLIEMFKPNDDGYIESWVWAHVEERESSTGRRYLTLA